MVPWILCHRLTRVSVVIDGESELRSRTLRSDAETARPGEEVDHGKLFDHGIPFELAGKDAVTIRGSSDIDRLPHSRIPSVVLRAGQRQQRVDDESGRVSAVAPQVSAQRLSPRELHDWIETSLVASGLPITALPGGTAKPFRYAIGGSRLADPTIVRIYAWNATHGGGPVRAADEFRIQLTTYLPAPRAGETLIIAGWSEQHRVFVGWDPTVHDHRDSYSPSLQVREEVMDRAAERGFAAGARASGDLVVAFRPQMLAAYCLNVHELHAGQNSDSESAATSQENRDHPVVPVEDFRRITVERRLNLAFRAWDFSNRVRSAYRHQCAMCGLGLELVEGAHIVPVAWPGSTDETNNGMALCRNHHAAYDRGIVSVSPDYEIQVSAELPHHDRVTAIDRTWIDDLDGRLLRILPDDTRERPSPRNLAIGREARRWAM